MDTGFRIVQIAEPVLCLTCRFHSFKTVAADDGSEKRMLHCTRLDCDQWVTDRSQPIPINIRD